MRVILGFFIFCIYRLLSLTWRVITIDPPDLEERLRKGLPVVFAHWHGDELAISHLIGHYRAAAMVSTSKDGDLMNTVLILLGGATSRGSSTRGGANALRGLLSLLKQGRNAVVAVDGPKGPIYKVKPGVFEISRLAQAPIFAARVNVDRAWQFPKAWNKTYLPKPFAKVHVEWVGTMGPITKDQDVRSESLAQELTLLLPSKT